jgi:YHS domain-containing protein
MRKRENSIKVRTSRLTILRAKVIIMSMKSSINSVSFSGLCDGVLPSEAQPRSSLAPDKNQELLASQRAPDPAQGMETVCHRMIYGDPGYYPRANFHGRTIYFCTETCQSVFLSDPERFFAVHGRRKPS